jgi:hypothetical protein
MSLTTWSPDLLARIDDDYDRDRARDGTSRFGSYLGHHLDLIRGYDERPIEPWEFATGAWQVATTHMDPGYVHIRPDLHGITLTRAEDGDDLVVTVRVPLTHYGLTRRPDRGWADWARDPYALAAHPAYWGRVEPADSRPAVLVTADVRFPLPVHLLPVPGHTGGPGLTTDAKAAVTFVVGHLNARAAHITALLQDQLHNPASTS